MSKLVSILFTNNKFLQLFVCTALVLVSLKMKPSDSEVIGGTPNIGYMSMPSYCVQQAQTEERQRRRDGPPDTSGSILDGVSKMSCINQISDVNYNNYKLLSSLPRDQREGMCRQIENDNQPLSDSGAERGLGYTLSINLCARSR